MIKVILADDHRVLIDGFINSLKSVDGIEIIGTANNGQQVLDILENKKADVVLLDIDMPIMDGLECCKLINQNYPETKVIALSMYEQGSFISSMIKNGAKGYLIKNSHQSEVIEAIKKVSEGETYFNDRIQQNILNHMMPGKNSSLIPKLTKREKEILKLIIDENTTQEIAEQLHISVNTVETHRKHLISKLNVKNVAGLVRVALERNLLDR